MKKIILTSPSTLLLKSHSNKFVMYDNQGRKVYDRDFKGRADNFNVNMPRSGEYFIDENSTVLDILPLIKNKITFTLPTPERTRFKPFTVEYNENLKGTPARIYTEIGRIEISPKFAKFDPPTKLFILLHELGHFFYQTEWKTDMFALYYYLHLGYNKSQAFYALSRILHPSPQNQIRINKLFNLVK